jgi:hypothetical protein
MEMLLQQLQEGLSAVNPGNNLEEKAAQAQIHYAAREIQATCAVLQDIKDQLQAKTGLDVGQDNELTALADDIMGAAGCTQ